MAEEQSESPTSSTPKRQSGEPNIVFLEINFEALSDVPISPFSPRANKPSMVICTFVLTHSTQYGFVEDLTNISQLDESDVGRGSAGLLKFYADSFEEAEPTRECMLKLFLTKLAGRVSAPAVIQGDLSRKYTSAISRFVLKLKDLTDVCVALLQAHHLWTKSAITAGLFSTLLFVGCLLALL